MTRKGESRNWRSARSPHAPTSTVYSPGRPVTGLGSTGLGLSSTHALQPGSRTAIAAGSWRSGHRAAVDQIHDGDSPTGGLHRGPQRRDDQQQSGVPRGPAPDLDVTRRRRTVEGAAKAPPEAGDVWTWLAFDPDTKLIISCLIGGRDKLSARAFAADVRSRVRTRRPQITSDGLDLYVDAIEEAFGADVDYGQILKVYARDPADEERRYSPPVCVTAKKRAISGSRTGSTSARHWSSART